MRSFLLIAGQDYYPVSQELELSSNVRRVCVDVFALADIISEGNEYFHLMLMSSMHDLELDPFATNVTIRNTRELFLFFYYYRNYCYSYLLCRNGICC